jgi:hypothetical protein
LGEAIHQAQSFLGMGLMHCSEKMQFRKMAKVPSAFSGQG